MRLKLGHLNMLARFVAAAAASAPHALVVPLPLTLLVTRRYRREELLKKLHMMVLWAKNVRRYVLGIKLEVTGQENLPRPDSRGMMFVSNHQSYVDIPVLMEALDTVAFLSKDLVAYLPFIGMHAYAGGTIFIKRGSKESRRKALEKTLRMCKESTAVVVFPEGTRSADGQLRQEIRTGSIEAAHEQGLSIIPVGLDGTYRVVPKTMDRVVTGEQVAVEVGAPLHPKDFRDSSEFAKAVWARVNELHLRCRARIS
ncbi:MAG TPA: lysophospholipid acyltransferase family protein [Myxococcota bacterium]|nr:lysophospholipid acyltransferase family protein [Myxococcota bacterium]HRY95886.1 lysophospholipid acyltransferase family protein [Myxococcota bacterium]